VLTIHVGDKWSDQIAYQHRRQTPFNRIVVFPDRSKGKSCTDRLNTAIKLRPEAGAASRVTDTGSLHLWCDEVIERCSEGGTRVRRTKVLRMRRRFRLHRPKERAVK
jgi:hypothetical protein